MVWVGSPADVMKACHVGWMSVEVMVMSLGSFLCFVVAGRSVALSVSMELRSYIVGPSLSL